MKKQIYILGSAILSIQLSAQITLTQTGNAPASGDVQSIKYLDSTASLSKTAGANVTLDYSSSVTNSTNTAVTMVTYTTASSIPGSSMFTSAGANVAATDSSEFYKSTSTTLEMLGNLSADGTYIFFSNSMKVMQFPFTYPNSFTDSYSGTLSVNGIGNFNLTGNLVVSSDAYGTVILPSSPSNLTFNNVLRVKMSNTMNIVGTGTLAFVTGTMITTDYMYFKSGTKNSFFQISYQYSDVPAFGPPSNNYSITYDASLPVNVTEISNQQPSLFIFPNPSNEYLKIQFNNADYTNIKISDIQGKIVKVISLVKNTEVQNIDIKDLSSGTYFIQLSGSEKGLSEVVYKFIKE
ncbi:MAG TPA: T9SS type A sorting domain-containing protein [Bacteroidia bacterium]|nr:T9SS type A sorting domain-containing protein [Bacteroidia bacterium]